MPIENHNSLLHDLDLSLLKHFFVVATHGGFSRAARATGQSQPALSQGLQKLERNLGAILIKRDSHQFELTDDGLRLFDFCKHLEGSLQSVVGTMGTKSSLFSRRLKLGTAFSVGFGPLVQACAKAARTEDQIEIELETRNTYQLIDELKRGHLDAALIPDDVHDSTLTMTRVSGDQIIVIAPSNFNSSLTKSNWRKTLQSACHITYMRETPMRALVDRFLFRESLEFTSSISANSADAIKMLVAEGVGIAFIMRSLAEPEIDRGILTEITLPVALPKCGIVLATRSDERGDLISETFAKLLQTTKLAR